MNQSIRIQKILLGFLAVFFALGIPLGQAASSEIYDLKAQADQLLKQGKIDQAIPLYETVLQKEKRFANAHYNLATAYYLKGDLGKAAESLEAFLHLEPKDAEALYNLGCLKIRLASFDEAMKCFLKAENCPCTRLISRKIKEALRFTKDLRRENPETKQLLAYLLSGSAKALFSAAD